MLIQVKNGTRRRARLQAYRSDRATARRGVAAGVPFGELEVMQGETLSAPVRDLEIPPLGLGARIGLPEHCRGIVLFAHGSGSSRFSTRNNYVAEALRASGLGTLLFDLLLAQEESDRRNVFDIGLLAERLLVATRWLGSRPELRELPVGYFGASTGAAAALVAAADEGAAVRAVVSRGGRPDLAGPALPRVEAPTLLIVGGWDTEVLALNREAFAQLHCEKRLEVVPGATHLFEEPGTLDAVVALARGWFTTHLGADPAELKRHAVR
jgi:putative phosphoribosyl transferase